MGFNFMPTHYRVSEYLHLHVVYCVFFKVLERWKNCRHEKMTIYIFSTISLFHSGNKSLRNSRFKCVLYIVYYILH